MLLQKLQLVLAEKKFLTSIFDDCILIVQINLNDIFAYVKRLHSNDIEIFIMFCYLIIMPSYICFRISLNSFLLRAFIFSLCRVVHCSCCIHQRALSIKYSLFSVFLADSLHYVYINTSICISSAIVFPYNSFSYYLYPIHLPRQQKVQLRGRKQTTRAVNETKMMSLDITKPAFHKQSVQLTVCI